MAIVDLRGREREPEVLALLDPGPAWNVVGWERDERLVACVGIERTSADELTVRALGALAEPDALALLDAIAGVATGLRIVAHVTDESAELYRSCGFVLETIDDGRFRAVRTLDEQAAPPASIRATTLDETQAAIRAAWGRDTSDDPDDWSELNPARGQCAVTALLVRELLGGEILVANVLLDDRRVERHAWNRLPSGLTLDLTREQFVNGERFGEPSPEEPLLTHRSPERLATLRARVRAHLELD